jgi:hypothetical protein
MKEEILKRAMFAMPLSKEAQGTGIMSGFDMDEMEDQDENADMEEMPPMARTPQNPEILMNTLRGDMRSVDARYMELAQMVGEEAAMETPPEVLAMLMGQMGAQQGGIGALPQGQAMAPPGAQAPASQAPGGQMPPPDQMGAPQPAPAMPQGGIPMPQGMESAPPFSQGAEAPQGYAYGGPVESTMPGNYDMGQMSYGDEMAPQGYAAGGIVRGAQFLGDKLGQFGSSANAALGRMFMTPQGISQPYLENLRGPGGKFTAEQVQRGGNLMQPTFTQGLQEGVTRLAEQYPRAAQMALPVAGMLGLAAAPKGGTPNQPMGSSLADQIPRDSIEELRARNVGAQAPAVSMSFDKPFTVADPSRYTATEQAPAAAPMAVPAAPSAEAAAPEADDLGAFITDKLASFDKRQKDTGVAGAIKEAVKEKSKADRIREGRAEYEPLFAEILGDDKESAKINALLLLSEAGLKLAGSRKPTAAMAVAEAFAGVPRGFAAIAAQERELGVKGKMAALQQAISDVDAQDKYAQAVKLKMLEGEYKILQEQAKQAGGGIVEDAGMGLRVTKTKNGSFVGSGIDPNDPSVKSAVSSRFTLRNTDNPYVENRGEAPTTIETDKSERVKLGGTLRSFDNSLRGVDDVRGLFQQLYSPGAFFVDKVNNLFVPLDPTGVIKPNLDQEDAKIRMKTMLNTLTKSIASANESGRVAVQEQEWARELAEAINNPVGFFQNKELAAKTLNAIETSLRNGRQQVLTQLGYEKDDYVMRTPNTGTKNDPFVVPSDPDQQRTMFTFLGSTIGKTQDPRAMVHLRMPNGTVQQFNPTQLRALNQ